MALGLKQAGTQLFAQVPFAQYCVVVPRDGVHLQATANPFAPAVARVADRRRAFGCFSRWVSGAEEDRLAGIGRRVVALCRLFVGQAHTFPPVPEGRASVGGGVAALPRSFRPP